MPEHGIPMPIVEACCYHRPDNLKRETTHCARIKKSQHAPHCENNVCSLLIERHLSRLRKTPHLQEVVRPLSALLSRFRVLPDPNTLIPQLPVGICHSFHCLPAGDGVSVCGWRVGGHSHEDNALLYFLFRCMVFVSALRFANLNTVCCMPCKPWKTSKSDNSIPPGATGLETYLLRMPKRPNYASSARQWYH